MTYLVFACFLYTNICHDDPNGLTIIHRQSPSSSCCTVHFVTFDSAHMQIAVYVHVVAVIKGTVFQNIFRNIEKLTSYAKQYSQTSGMSSSSVV